VNRKGEKGARVGQISGSARKWKTYRLLAGTNESRPQKRSSCVARNDVAGGEGGVWFFLPIYRLGGLPEVKDDTKKSA